MVIVIGKRFRERKKPVVKFMFYFSLFMSLAILMAAFSRILRYTGVWELGLDKYLEFLAFTISFIAIGNIFMLAFCLEVFTKAGVKSKSGKTILIIYSILIAAFIGYAIADGIFSRDLTTLIWGIAIVLSLFVYGWTMIAALKLASKLEKGPDKVSAVMISLSPLSIMMVFVMFFIDRMLLDDFTWAYYVGWAFVIVSMITIYIGVIRPAWLFKEKTQ